MAAFTFTSPEGKSYTVNGPDGATPEQAFGVLQSQLKASGSLDYYKNMSAPVPVDPTQGMSGTDKFLAGVGMGMTRLGRGIGQAVGLVDQSQINDAHQLEAPLANTTAGKVGNVVGTVAALVPTAFIPGANTIAGAAAIGAGTGALTTEGDLATRGKAALGGAIGGAGGILTGRVLAKGLNALGNKAAQAAGTNAVRNAAIANGQDLGLAVSPATANPTLLNKTLEGFAGKLSTAQKVSNVNAPRIDAVARNALGLAEDVPLNDQTFATIRQQAGQAYESLRGAGQIKADPQFAQDLSGLVQKFQGAAKDFPELADGQVAAIANAVNKPSFDAGSALDAISILRDRATTAYANGDKGLGKVYRGASDALESVIERNLERAGAPAKDMLDNFRNARQLIAKSYTVQSALDGGNVSAPKLAAMLKRGKPLSGDLKTVAQFADAVPKAVQSPSKVGTVAGTSPLDWAVAGAGALHNPLLAAGVFARPLVRNALVSSAGQSLARAPINPGATRLALANALLRPDALSAAGVAGNSLSRN